MRLQFDQTTCGREVAIFVHYEMHSCVEDFAYFITLYFPHEIGLYAFYVGD